MNYENLKDELSQIERDLLINLDTERAWPAHIHAFDVAASVRHVKALLSHFAERGWVELSSLTDEETGKMSGRGYTLTPAGAAARLTLARGPATVRKGIALTALELALSAVIGASIGALVIVAVSTFW